jgi:hypothetical protein
MPRNTSPIKPIWWLRAGRAFCLVVVGMAACSGDQAAAPTVQAADVGRGDESARDVGVTTDKSSYRPGEPIVVTVDNQLSVPVYALTGQTYCTVVTAERRVDDAWRAEGRCMVGGPPGWREIPPQQLTRVEVNPGIALDEPLPPGRYRVVFTFRPKSTAEPSAAVIAKEFIIASG